MDKINRLTNQAQLASASTLPVQIKGRAPWPYSDNYLRKLGLITNPAKKEFVDDIATRYGIDFYGRYSNIKIRLKSRPNYFLEVESCPALGQWSHSREDDQIMIIMGRDRLVLYTPPYEVGTFGVSSLIDQGSLWPTDLFRDSKQINFIGEKYTASRNKLILTEEKLNALNNLASEWIADLRAAGWVTDSSLARKPWSSKK